MSDPAFPTEAGRNDRKRLYRIHWRPAGILLSRPFVSSVRARNKESAIRTFDARHERGVVVVSIHRAIRYE